MRADQILVGQEETKPRVHRPDPESGWRLAGAFGLLFTLVGLTDVALAIYPANLSDPAVRFVTFSGIITGTPILAVGLVLILFSAIQLEALGRLRLATLATALAGLVMLVLLVSFLLARGAAVQALPANAQTTVSRTVLRVTIFGLTFASMYLIAAAAGFRSLRQPRRT